MNRRDFIKYCAGTSLLAAIAPFDLALPEEIPVGSFPMIAKTPSIWRELIHLYAYGVAERSEQAFITVARKNMGQMGMLWKFAMNAGGGYLSWVPRADDGIIDMPEHPLTCFTDSPNVRMGAVFRHSNGTREFLIGGLAIPMEAPGSPQAPRLVQG